MKNKSKIQGDGNVNIQGISRSKFLVSDKIVTGIKANKFWIITTVIIALLGLIVQVLIGWEQLINMFYA